MQHSSLDGAAGELHAASTYLHPWLWAPSTLKHIFWAGGVKRSTILVILWIYTMAVFLDHECTSCLPATHWSLFKSSLLHLPSVSFNFLLVPCLFAVRFNHFDGFKTWQTISVWNSWNNANNNFNFQLPVWPYVELVFVTGSCCLRFFIQKCLRWTIVLH